MKKLCLSMIALALIWSCGKDDGPTTPKNAVPIIKAQEFTVFEGITDTKVIGTVAATDADKDALTFSIKTNDNALFEITAAGELSLASGKSLDFATKAQHAITVEVGDGEDSATAEMTIKVTETNLQNSAPEMADQEFTVAENIAETVVIGTVVATDADGDELTFDVFDDVSSLFEIDAATGELSLKVDKSLDFETATQHVISVEVGDGITETMATITIKVTDADESLASDPNAFVTTWKTDANNEEIIIGTNDALTYGYTIDWGDGTVEEITSSGNALHVYATAGIHTVAIIGDFPHISMYDSSGDRELKLLSIEQWGAIQWKSMEYAFAECENMVHNATDVPDLSQVTDMGSMFNGATAFNGDLSGWDTSKVTDMQAMFYEAAAFKGDLSSWDTSSVTNMSYMFNGATAFNGDLSGWDTSSVTSMSHMFDGATAFNGDIDGWGTKTGNVTNMSGMFVNATSFNQDLNSWDTSSVTNMSGMFLGALAFNGDLSGWDTSSVTNMAYMFSEATAYMEDSLNGWDTSNVTNMTFMFQGATSFNGHISNWDTSNVTNMSYMLSGATAFNGALNWDISNVTNLAGMLDHSGISPLSYGNILIAWANLPNVPSGITLGAEGLTIDCNHANSLNAWLFLTQDPSWTINDDTAANCGG